MRHQSHFFSIQQWSSNWALNAWGPSKDSMGTDNMLLEVTSSRFAIFKCVFFYKINLCWKHLEAASQFSFPSLLPHSLHILKKRERCTVQQHKGCNKFKVPNKGVIENFYICRASMKGNITFTPYLSVRETSTIFYSYD